MMEPIPIWIFIRVEVTTDGGLLGHYWLARQFSFPTLPPIGMELDYRARKLGQVLIDKLVYDPECEQYKGYQTSWISIGVGDLALWEHAGWIKMEMSEADQQDQM